MRISDWSSDVCSSDLAEALLADLGDDEAYLSCTLLAQLMAARRELYHFHDMLKLEAETRKALGRPGSRFASIALKASVAPTLMAQGKTGFARQFLEEALERSEEHTSELQSLMRISYAVLCLKKNTNNKL